MSLALLPRIHVYTDGASRGNPGPAAIGIVVCDAYDRLLEEKRASIGRATNNEAEYQAVIRGLEASHNHTRQKVVCYSDSQLLVRQLRGEYRIQEPHLQKLASTVREKASRFVDVTFQHVPRRHPMIQRADELANRALDERYGRG